jgi:hypothetical protein
MTPMVASGPPEASVLVVVPCYTDYTGFHAL